VLGYRRDLSEPGDTAVALPGLCSPAKAADCGS
jgi:hypothetical protein